MAVTFQQLVDHVITNAQFRHQFEKDPVAAAESFGVHMTPALQHALQKLDINGIKQVAIQMQGAAQFT